MITFVVWRCHTNIDHPDHMKVLRSNLTREEALAARQRGPDWFDAIDEQNASDRIAVLTTTTESRGA